MKYRKYHVVVGALIFLLASSFYAQEKKNPVALVQKTINEVHYKALESNWASAKPGIALKDGEEIKTGVKSLALVKFLDGSLIRVRENTILNIYGKKENNSQNTNTVVTGGQINFDVQKQGNSEFTFTTPTGIASIRGTSGIVEVPDGNSSTFILETGLMELQASFGDQGTATLTPGNTATITKDGTITITESSEDDKNKLDKTKYTRPHKIIIETEEGTFEFEYLDKEE